MTAQTAIFSTKTTRISNGFQPIEVNTYAEYIDVRDAASRGCGLRVMILGFSHQEPLNHTNWYDAQDMRFGLKIKVSADYLYSIDEAVALHVAPNY